MIASLYILKNNRIQQLSISKRVQINSDFCSGLLFFLLINYNVIRILYEVIFISSKPTMTFEKPGEATWMKGLCE